jgi:electron transfer flavoprotein alpha subunit
VRLVAVPPRAPAARAAALAAAVTAASHDEPVVVLLAAGPAGTELAARLAQRTGGSALTGVLAAEAEAAGAELVCRRAVYSGHLAARFALRAAPWCLVLDASWDDAGEQDAADAGTLTHGAGARLLGDERAPAAAVDDALEDVSLEAAPAGDELSAARVLVVAGRGAGSREGVARIAAAAARLGAALAVSRPVAMNAWAPMDRLVGVSGARVAPALCIVAGASGAPALLWGIERAGYIVAVTTDEAAPLLHEADAVVLGDAVTTMEELARAVAAAGRGTRA